MMTAFEAYKDYMALKLHFTSDSYSYVKYNGKMSITKDRFDSSKDKFWAEKLAKIPDHKNFLIANLFETPKVYIRDLVTSEHCMSVYLDWQRRQQSLTYVYKEDLKKLNENFNENFYCKDRQHPLLLKMYLSREITVETFCILLILTGAIKSWNKIMANDILWKEYGKKFLKYMEFFTFDKEKFKRITLDTFKK